uniref:Very-long-chain (3R)-3-hydroxyacyl-CoA dehydratase n=1 Tax=Heterorhabditis bacteriophora TaxID=37862 RepID=A0A1I7WLJ8_HETBA
MHFNFYFAKNVRVISAHIINRVYCWTAHLPFILIIHKYNSHFIRLFKEYHSLHIAVASIFSNNYETASQAYEFPRNLFIFGSSLYTLLELIGFQVSCNIATGTVQLYLIPLIFFVFYYKFRRYSIYGREVRNPLFFFYQQKMNETG